MNQRDYDFLMQRAETFFERLKKRFFFETMPLTAEVSSSVAPVAFGERLKGEFRSIREGEKWGNSWDSAWFRLSAEVPAAWKGEALALRLDLGGEALLFSADGVPLYGFSAGSVYGFHYRKDLYQLPEAAAGSRVEFWVEAAANALFGLKHNDDPELDEPEPYGKCDGIAVEMKIGRFNRELWHLCLDVEILVGLLKELPGRSRRGDLIITALDRAADALGEDPRNAAKARRELAPEFARRANASAMTATGIGHAHIDTGWLWPVRESVRKCGRTFASQLDLLEKYPEYLFGASSPQHYAFVKEHYPALYEKIKARVAEGRWELQGGMWVEADCNLPSGESLTRQFLFGKNFFRDEFGIEVDNLWIPDVFGYPGSLPQISKKAGCPHFVTQKMSWSWSNKFPYNAFRWQGIDGSEVLSFFPPEATYNSSINPKETIRGEQEFQERTLTDEYLSLCGIGNGGGGPKEEYLERARRLADFEGTPKFRFGRADDFLHRLEGIEKNLPVWEGELYLEFHRGTLTTQARTKRNNRKLEELLAAAEALCSALPPAAYPGKELEKVWKTLLINQFHDIIPGSSITRVYQVTEGEHAEAIAEARRLIENAAGQLLRRDEACVTFYNSLSAEWRGVVELPLSWFGSGAVDAEGRRIPVQGSPDGRVRARLTVPALGFVTLRRCEGEGAERAHSAGLVLENRFVRYAFDADGRLLSAFDKTTGLEVLEAGEAGNRLALYVDRPNRYEAWDIDDNYVRNLAAEAKSSAPPREFAGPAGNGIEFTLGIGESAIRQRVTLSEDSARLDFETAVDWRERRKMLRVAFPTSIQARESVSDIQYGFVRRPTHTNTSWDRARFEVAAHKYADFSEERRGAALLNDCKYGHRLLGSTLDLALLRSPLWPDWDADRGEQFFTYSFLPHAGNHVEGGVYEEAIQLNRPPLRLEGFAGGMAAPFRLEGENVNLTALKKAEKEDSLVIRLVETAGLHSKMTVYTDRKLVETNLIEWTNEGELVPVNGRVELEFTPFQLRTFKLI